MVEQDYIMRTIKEMVRTLMRLLFHIDTESPTEELLQDKEEKDALQRLLSLVERGDINEAENCLYEMTSAGDKRYLKLAVLFYSRLNEYSDAFLEDHAYSREEIRQGLEALASTYHLYGMLDVFLDEV